MKLLITVKDKSKNKRYRGTSGYETSLCSMLYIAFFYIGIFNIKSIKIKRFIKKKKSEILADEDKLFKE